MYNHNENQIMLPHDFFLPFGGKLNPQNRWCRLARLIPWTQAEEKYIQSFKSMKIGQPAFSVRMALGALIIQNQKGLTDRETVEEIAENPYLQYFIGLAEFTDLPPFDASLLVHFRKRLGKDIINEINELITKAETTDSDKNDHNGGPGNKGKLILDATCVPSDVHFPTDTWLLNRAREVLEDIIDTLHKPLVGKHPKPRMYRKRARKDYLNIDKKKRKSQKEVRKAVGKQLRYIKRDITAIEVLATRVPLALLSRSQYRNLLVCQEVYRQQQFMHLSKTHQVADRIVSLHMPFVRPIVRGKASADVEFGAKLAISIVNGYAHMEHLSFDAYNEGITLAQTVERYRKRFGHYPEAVLADKIYRNRENLAYCKSKGIRLSGPPLGRPASDQVVLKAQQRQERADSGERNQVEGKFGEGKRKYGLGKIMTRLAETSQAVIAMQLLVMNLERKLRLLLHYFWKHFFSPPELLCG